MGNALGQYITHYRFKYFYNPDGQGWKWVPQAGAKEEIYKKLKPLALRMDADDYLELPEINDVPIFLSYPLMRERFMTNLRMIWLLRSKSVSLQPPTLPRRAASSGKL
jgi:hypothetical protein